MNTTDWWWFDPSNAGEKGEAALAWETIRRTKAYPALWRKCVREKASFAKNTETPVASESLRLASLFPHVRGATDDLCWWLLMHEFDPGLDWLELSERQRLEAQGFSKCPPFTIQ